MTKFKIGDRVIVNESPTVGRYDIDVDFPFETTIVSGLDRDDDYETYFGWYVKEDMLTLVSSESDPLTEIRYVLSLNLSDAIKIAAIKELVGE